MCCSVIPFKVLLSAGIIVPILQKETEVQKGKVATQLPSKVSRTAHALIHSILKLLWFFSLWVALRLFPVSLLAVPHPLRGLGSVFTEHRLGNVAGEWEWQVSLRSRNFKVLCLLCHIIPPFSLPLDQRGPRSKYPVNLGLKVKTIQRRVRAIHGHIRKESWDLGVSCYTV